MARLRFEAEDSISFIAQRVHERMNYVFDNFERVARHPKTYLVIVYIILVLIVVFL